MTGPIRAAGVVLWRGEHTGEVEIGLVHRPRYDDWTHPKGKLDPDEQVLLGAARETREEAGSEIVVGAFLGSVGYQVATADGRHTDKTVDYFSARSVGGTFVPGEEVDELRWVAPERALELLSYPYDQEVLTTWRGLPIDPLTVILVRHAKAGKRDEWSDQDDLRPLSRAGWAQAEVLREVLALYSPAQVYSAPRVRCLQTVAGLAGDMGVPIGEEPLLAEEGYWPAPVRGVARLLELVSSGRRVVLSGQGGVIPDLVDRLAGEHRPESVPSRKGSYWVLSLDPDTRALVAADYHEPTDPRRSPVMATSIRPAGLTN